MEGTLLGENPSDATTRFRARTNCFGDSYDNRLPESIIELRKTEGIAAAVRGALSTTSDSPSSNGSTDSATAAS